MRGIKTAVMMLVLLSFVFAQNVLPGGAEQTLRDALPPWLPLLAVAIFIGYGIVAMIYMISKVFKVRELEAWAKTNFGEVTGSIFLVVIILIVIGFADSVFTAVVGNSPYDVSTSYMDGAAQKLFDIYVEGVWFNTAVGSLTGAPLQYSGQGHTSQGKAGPQDAKVKAEGSSDRTVVDEASLSIPILIFQIDLFRVSYEGYRGGSVFLTGFGTIQSIVLSSTFITLISSMILDFVREVAIPVMVPFGMLFSSFSVTRKLGRTLIAFGVGLHLFVPVSILMSQQMFQSAYSGSGTNPPEISNPGSIRNFTSRVLAHSMGRLLLATSVGPMIAGALGSNPFKLLCFPICALLALTCLVFFAACFNICFQPCYNFVMPYVVYPIAKVFGEVGVPILRLINDFQLYALFDVDPIAYILQPIGLIPSNPLGGIAKLLAQYYVDSALNLKLAEMTLEYIPYILQYSVPIILTPLIILVVVVTAIRSLSPAIGGEIQILGVSELI